MNIIRKIGFRFYIAASWFDGRLFRFLRRKSLELATGRRIPLAFIDPDVRITGASTLKLGRNVSLHYWTFLSADGGLTIGNDVAIGHGCSIMTTEHGFDNTFQPIKAQPITKHPVLIGDDVWIGANVTILAGVTIGPRSVVGAGAVVTQSFPDGHVVLAGVPARVIRKLPCQ